MDNPIDQPTQTSDLVLFSEYALSLFPENDSEIPKSFTDAIKKGEKVSKVLVDAAIKRIVHTRAEADTDFINRKVNAARAQIYGSFESELSQLAGLTPEELKAMPEIKDKVQAVKAALEAHIRELAGKEMGVKFSQEYAKIGAERDNYKLEAEKANARFPAKEIEVASKMSRFVADEKINAALVERKHQLVSPNPKTLLPWLKDELYSAYSFSYDQNNNRMEIKNKATDTIVAKSISDLVGELLTAEKELKVSNAKPGTANTNTIIPNLPAAIDTPQISQKAMDAYERKRKGAA